MEMTYKEFINNILETRGRNGCGEEYHETHHILPKCMGGSNDKENLIDLFAREHFEAHRLLALENPENEKLVYAWWMMAHTNNANQRDYEITVDEYEEAKIVFSQTHSDLQKQKMSLRENREKISKSLTGRYIGDKNPNYGKHLPEEVRNRISNFAKTRIKELNPFYGKHHTEETKNKIRKSLIGKLSGENNPNYGKKMTEEQKKKISETLTGKMSGENNPMYGVHRYGENNPMYGKRHTEDSKEKMRNSKLGKYNNEKNPRATEVVCIETEEILWGAKAFETKYGINRCAITMCCRGQRKTAGGYQWKYLYDQTCKDGTVIPGAISLGLITEEEALKQLAEQENLKGEISGKKENN